eukprot:1972804-Pleurochrysis_carterae.AAC.1
MEIGHNSGREERKCCIPLVETASLRFLDDISGVASPDTLLLSLSSYLLQSLASIIAASGHDNYGRAYYECGVWKGNLVITTARLATPRAHDYTVETEAKSPLDH